MTTFSECYRYIKIFCTVFGTSFLMSCATSEQVHLENAVLDHNCGVERKYQSVNLVSETEARDSGFIVQRNSTGSDGDNIEIEFPKQINNISFGSVYLLTATMVKKSVSAESLQGDSNKVLIDTNNFNISKGNIHFEYYDRYSCAPIVSFIIDPRMILRNR